MAPPRDDASAFAVPGLPAIVDVRRWAVWSQRPRLIAYCVVVELAAVVLTLFGPPRPAQPHQVLLTVLLAGFGIGQAEISRQVERARRSLSDTPHINMTSVWTFAAVLLLSPVNITAVAVALYAHAAFRVWRRMRRLPVFRVMFNASLVIVTCLASRSVLSALDYPGLKQATHSGWHGFAPIAAGAAAYFVLGALLAVPGLSLTSHTFEALFGTLMDNALEMTTLCLGAINAVVLVAMPELGVAIIPAVLMLQRSMLVQELEVAAITDDKTGVLNTAGWHRVASRELSRAARSPDSLIGVLMIDLDHFKQVNDRHGHLAGDTVLKAVATRIAGEVREYDSVGRFGGEEFVVLLPRSSQGVACEVAERIRSAIRALRVPASGGGDVDADRLVIDGLSASIGVAMYPTEGVSVDPLLRAADEALYRAKTAGRDRVVVFSAAR